MAKFTRGVVNEDESKRVSARLDEASQRVSEVRTKKLFKRGKDMNAHMKAIRMAVADYMRTEGCTCCQDIDGHKQAEARLATLLDVPQYDDNSGYDFRQFRSKGVQDDGE